MADVAETVQIDTAPDAVWEAIARFDAISAWAPNVDHSCLTSEQGDGVGAVRRVQVGRNALLERIIVWDPPNRLAYEIDGLPPVIRSVTNTWELVDAGGATSVTLTTNVDAGPRPPQQLVARVAGRALAKASREMLAGLQRHLEQVAS